MKVSYTLFASILLMQIFTLSASASESATLDTTTEPPKEIHFIRRSTGQEEIENVMGNGMIRFTYHTRMGKLVAQRLVRKRWPSKLMGFSKNTKRSAKKIPEFIEHYEVKMNEFEDRKFTTFNDFFARKFRDGARVFNSDPAIVSAGAEARYLVMENVGMDTVFPVKGARIFLPELFGSAELAHEFEGGAIVIARLCPVDYHRFHFPTDASVSSSYRIHGNYDSVNPIALAAKPDILFKNERQVSLLENPNFGKFAMIEVGAFAVGKIIQSAYDTEAPLPTTSFKKGQEKGYFQFGASTVIWVFKKGQMIADRDLVENSLRGMETLVELGDQLGRINKP